jgi:hypothetical protein
MVRMSWDALGEIEDRRGRQGRNSELRSILGIAIAAMLSGSNDLLSIFRWGRGLKPEALKLFGVESGRAPCHATYYYFFKRLDAGALSVALGRFAPGFGEPGHLAIDGKTLRGSRRRDAKPLHVLSAFAASLSAVTGDLAVAPGAAAVRAGAILRRRSRAANRRRLMRWQRCSMLWAI